jgi:Phage tail tube protein, GTA-gp10
MHVSFKLDGRKRTLVLTLGALAEIEHELGEGGLAALAARLAEGKLSVSDAITVLAAGLRGSGEAMDRDALGRAIPAADLGVALNTAAALLAASFGGGSSSRPPPPQVAS